MITVQAGQLRVLVEALVGAGVPDDHSIRLTELHGHDGTHLLADVSSEEHLTVREHSFALEVQSGD